MSRKPNFFIVGAPKAGTTAVYHQLKVHPDIYMSPVKEPNFFSKGDPTDPQAILDYERLFRLADNESIVGEASVSYMHNPMAIGHLKKYNPAAKILILIRQPVLRAHSHYLMMRSQGADVPFASFDDASVKTAAALERGEKIPYGSGYWQSFYAESIGNYQREFPGNVLIMLNEDLKANRDGSYRSMLAFLGVDDSVRPDEVDKNYNVGGGNTRSGALQKIIFSQGKAKNVLQSLVPKSVREALRTRLLGLNRVEKVKLSPEEVKRYTALFADDIAATSALIGRDLSAWLEGDDVATASVR